MRVYKVTEDEQKNVLGFVASLDIKSIAGEVMQRLFKALEMRFEFKLSKDGKREENR